MRVSAAVVLVGLGVAVGTAAAWAAQPWRVFATGNDSSDYAAFASASADAPRSRALAVRVTAAPAQPVHIDVFLNCSVSTTAKSGTLLVMTTPLFSKCSLMGSGRTDNGGRVKIELLRR